MRKIEKPSLVPDNLTQAQEKIATKLFEQKNNFKWLPEHYNSPIKAELKALYHNKCAFCEIILTDRKKAANEFTVEHFRYKAHYYWLGNEWTNLFPLCFACNNAKGNNFPTSGQKITTPPFDKDGNLIRGACLATHEKLLNEKPLYIHPEVEDGKLYFSFNQQPTDRELTLAFNVIFKQLLQRQIAEAEYSLLGYAMFTQFDTFFLSEYENDIKNLVRYAFELFIQKHQ